MPLVGTVDTAVLGRLPDETYIAAVALGALVFSSTYWMFGFLRMGTTALVAQQHGAREPMEIRLTLLRAGMIAVGVAALVIALGLVARGHVFGWLTADATVANGAAEYFSIRLLGTPAYLLYLVVLGALFGTQRMRSTLLLTLLFNGLNIALDLYFVVVAEMGVAGVAWGTVISEWVTVVLGVWIVGRSLGLTLALRQPDLWLRDRWRRLFAISGDLLLRTLCVQVPFIVTTAAAARLGTGVLAANAILLNFLFLISHALDGIAHAAESLGGFAAGRRAREELLATARYTLFWGTLLGLLLAGVLLLADEQLVGLMTTLDTLITETLAYLPWLAPVALFGAWAFVYDGLFIGLTAVRELRNAMAIATLGYLLVVWGGLDRFGNHALWAGMSLFMALRALLLLRAFGGVAARVPSALAQDAARDA